MRFCARLLIVLAASASSWLSAQKYLPVAPPQADRVVTTATQERLRVRGDLSPLLGQQQDLGTLPPDTPIRNVVLTLSRSPETEAAFRKLLQDQDDPGSSFYRHWLTPAQVGELYGPTQHDLDAVTAWLESNGLRVQGISSSRIAITFSGSAGSLGPAFGTSLHNFKRADGSSHYAITAAPTLPAALAAVTLSVVGLTEEQLSPKPVVQQADYSGVASADYASRYGLFGFSKVNVQGAGQRVAILASSRVNNDDIAAYQNNRNFPPNLPTILVPPFTTDPGITGDSAQVEATLDVERVLGTAPSASVDLLAGKDLSTTTLLGLINYASGTLNDPIMNLSFYGCEANLGQSATLAFDSAFATAHAQGIAVYVASGDSGAAGCETHGAASSAAPKLSANALCASQYATCVGGTQVVGSNSVAEAAWNEPGTTNFVVDASGGGASVYVAKPSWQTGVGVPSDGARDTPDLSLPAASTSGYQACIFGSSPTKCVQYTVGGTSASAPTLAGMSALWNTQAGVRLGGLNSSFYQAAASPLNLGFIHDVNLATAGVTTCDLGTPSNCNNSTPSPFNLKGGLRGYALGTGYDQVTGLGTLNAYDFGQFLYGGKTAAPLQLLYANPTTNIAFPISTDPVAPGGSMKFTATFPAGTSPVPTGLITFFQPQFLNPPVDYPLAVPVTTPASTEPVVTQTLPSVATAQNLTVIAHYSGDSNYAPAEITTVVPFTGTKASAVTLTSSTGTTVSTSPVVLTAVLRCTTCTGTAPAPSGKMYFIMSPYSANNNGSAPYIVLGSVDSPSAANTWTLTAYLPFGELCNCGETNTLYAYFVGDSSYAPATSNSLSVGSYATGTSVQSYTPDNNYNVGWNTPFQAACSINVSGKGIPTPLFYLPALNLNTLSFAVGGGTLTSPVVISPTSSPTVFTATATAVMNVPGTPALAQEIDCQYYGDYSFYSASNLSRAALTVAPEPALSVLLTAQHNNIQVNVADLLTATFISNTAGTGVPDGLVTLTEGTKVLGTAHAVATSTPGVFVATFSQSFATAGLHNVGVAIPATAIYSAVISAGIGITATTQPVVDPVLTVASASALSGMPSAFTLTLTMPSADSPAPTVPIKFYDNGTSVSVAPNYIPVGGGVYTLSYSPSISAVGAHNVYAVYPGQGTYAAQTSNTILVTVSKATPVITVAPATTLVYGTAGSVPLTVGLAGDSLTPTSIVGYTLNGVTKPVIALVNGALSIPFPATTAEGVYTVVLTYYGDNYFTTATATITVTVAKTATKLTWAVPSAIPYGTALSSTQLNATANVPGSITYSPGLGTVLAAGTQSVTATFTPTDSTTYAGATATVNLVVNPAPLTVTVTDATRKYASLTPVFYYTVTGAVNNDVITATTATTATAVSPVGVYPITATVYGSALPNYNVTVNNGKLTITQNTSSTTVAASATSLAYGQNLTLTASVNAPATGTVQFMNAGIILGTANIVAGSNFSTATFTSSSLGAGSYSITAVYPGDGNYVGSTSAPVAVTITGPTLALALSAAATTVNLNTADLLTLKLTPGGSAVPTGTVTFLDNGTAIGSTTTLTPSGGAYLAVFNASFATGGTHAITAQYSGGAGYGSQAAGGLTITVNRFVSTLSAPAASSFVYGAGGTVEVLASGTGTTAVPTGSLTYVLVSGASQTVALSNGSAAVGIPTSLATGTYALTLSYAGDATFNAASNLAVSVTISKAVAKIQWATPSAIVYGVPLSATQLNATASIAGTFAYTPAVNAVIAAGTQTLTAVFTPTDSVNYGPVTSTVSLQVNQAPLTVKAADATRKYGVTNPAFSATVSGTVNGDTLTASASTSATTTSPAGTYSIVPAAAGANINSYLVAPQNGTLTVTQAGSTAALAASATTLPMGQTLLLTATISPGTTGTPTGTVSFLSGPAVLGTGTLSSGVATFSTSQLTPAAYSITAAYSGDANFTASTSGASTVTVTAPMLTLTPSVAATTLLAGATDLLKATLAPSGSVVPTGTVNFLDNGTVIGSSSLSPSGSAYLATYNATLATGAHAITMAYTGGSGYAAQTSASIAVMVNKNSSAIAAPATSSFVYGVGGSIAITLAGPGTTLLPTGSLTYTIGSGAAQTAPVSNGTAVVPVPAAQPLGSYTVNLAYAGDANFAAASNTQVGLVISKAAPTLTWAAPAAVPYGTALSATQLNASASIPGTYAYTPASGAVLTAGIQTLSVTFTPTDLVNYAAATSTVKLVVNPAPLTVKAADVTRKYGLANPVFPATLTGVVNGDVLSAQASSTAIATSGAGTYSIVPTVTGNAASNYTITPLNGSLTITQADSLSVAAVAAGTLPAGQNAQFSATITSSTSGVPTGSVSFLSGSTVLGSTLLVNGSGSLSVALAPGSYTVVVAYAGDANFIASNSQPVSLVVTAPTLTIALSAAALAVTTGTPDALKLTLTPASSVVPTGMVTFYDGSSVIGVVTGLTPAGTVYTATYPATFSTAGNHTITAVYSGGSGYASQTSSSLVISATTPPGLLLTPASTSLSFTAGAGTGNTVTLSISGAGGFAGTVSMACSLSVTGGNPSVPATCNVAPATLTVTAGAASTAVATITSSARTAALSSPQQPSGALPPVAFATLLLAPLGLLLRRRITAVRLTCLLLLAAFGTAGLSGCGSTPGQTKSTATAGSAGSYTMLITASGTNGSTPISSSTSVAVTIN